MSKFPVFNGSSFPQLLLSFGVLWILVNPYTFNVGVTASVIDTSTSESIGIWTQIQQWFFGADGTISIYGINNSTGGPGIFSIFGLQPEVQIQMKPLWDTDSSFPPLGTEGVLVLANPTDACYNLEDPPKDMTSPEIIEVAEESNSTNFSNNWFLLVNDDNCDRDTKLQNANLAGYVFVIFELSPNSAESNSETFNVTFSGDGDISDTYACSVDQADGQILENYAYPLSYSAKIIDRRKWQWRKAAWKIATVTAGLAGTAALAAGTAFAITKKLKKQAELKAAITAKEELKKRVAKNLPSDKWEVTETNIRRRCKYCHRYFDSNDDVTTLDCSHQYHKSCLVIRILAGKVHCPFCGIQIHDQSTPEPPVDNHDLEYSTESTPLIEKSGKRSVISGKISADDKQQRYHCHICEILGLPMMDEVPVDLEDQHHQDRNTNSSHIHFQIPSRQISYVSSRSISIGHSGANGGEDVIDINESDAELVNTIDEQGNEFSEVDAEVAHITGRGHPDYIEFDGDLEHVTGRGRPGYSEIDADIGHLTGTAEGHLT